MESPSAALNARQQQLPRHLSPLIKHCRAQKMSERVWIMLWSGNRTLFLSLSCCSLPSWYQLIRQPANRLLGLLLASWSYCYWRSVISLPQKRPVSIDTQRHEIGHFRHRWVHPSLAPRSCISLQFQSYPGPHFYVAYLMNLLCFGFFWLGGWRRFVVHPLCIVHDVILQCNTWLCN